MTAPQVFTSAADRKVVDLRSDISDVKLKKITAGIGHAQADGVDKVRPDPDTAIKVRDDSALLPSVANASPTTSRQKRVPEKTGGHGLRNLSNERTPSFRSRQAPPKKTHAPLIPVVYPPTRGHAKDRLPSRTRTKEEPVRAQSKELPVTDELSRTSAPESESLKKQASPPAELPPSRLPAPLSVEELLAKYSVNKGPAHSVDYDGGGNLAGDRPQTDCRQETSRRQGKGREKKKTLLGAKSAYGEVIDMRKLNKKIKILEVDYKHYQKVLRRASPRYQDGLQRRLEDATEALNEEERRARKLFSLTQTLTNKDQRASPLSPNRERAEIQRLEGQIVNFERRSAKCLERKTEVNIKIEDVQHKIEKLSASVAECTGLQQKQLAERRAKEKLMELTRRTREQELSEEVEEVLAKRHLLQRRFSQSIQSQQFVLQGLEERLKSSVEKQKRLDAQLEQWRKRQGDHVIDFLGDSLSPKRSVGLPPGSRSKFPPFNAPTKPRAAAASSTSIHSGSPAKPHLNGEPRSPPRALSKSPSSDFPTKPCASGASSISIHSGSPVKSRLNGVPIEKGHSDIAAPAEDAKTESEHACATSAAPDLGPHGFSSDARESVNESRRANVFDDGVVVVETSGKNTADAVEARIDKTACGKTSMSPHPQQLSILDENKKIDDTASSLVDEDFESCTPSAASATANETMMQQLQNNPAPLADEMDNYSKDGGFEAETLSLEDNVNGQLVVAVPSGLMPEPCSLPDSKEEATEMPPPTPKEVGKVQPEEEKSEADALLSREEPVHVVARPMEAEDTSGVIAPDTVKNKDEVRETAPQWKKLGRRRQKEESAKDNDDFDALLFREEPVRVVARPSEVEDASDVIAPDIIESMNEVQETAPQPKKLGRRRPKEESAKEDDDLDIDFLLSKK